MQAKCRLCDSKKLKTYLDLGKMPLAGEFKDKIEKEKIYSLKAFQCQNCWLVQLLSIVPKEELFQSFLTAYSLKEHFREFAKEMRERFLESGDFVVEIGSNDGTLLKFLKEKGIKILGIEPVKKIAQIALKQKLPTIVDYFSFKIAKKINKKADAVFANNVLAHINDMDDVMEGINFLLKNEGILVFEVHHFLNILKEGQYDNFYHEHLNYYMVGPLAMFLNKHGFEITEIKPIPTHGGSMRIYAQKIPKIKLRSFTLQHKKKLLSLLRKLKKEKKTIVGYGASGRGNTLLNFCGIDSSFLDYIIDESPLRYGKYTPGSHLPIVSPKEFKGADYVFILAWNYKEEIIAKIKKLGFKGKFIVPLPKIEII